MLQLKKIRAIIKAKRHTDAICRAVLRLKSGINSWREVKVRMSILDAEKKIKEGVIKPEAENDSTAETAIENENTPSPETPAETMAGSAETVTSTDADTLTAGQDSEGGEEKIHLDETENNSASPTSAEEQNGAEDKVEKAIFTQTQMNRLAGKAREEGRASALKDLFARYGVADEDELNGIFGKGQTYDDLNDEYAAQGNSIREVRAENALLRTGIVPERWDDVKAILGTKGLEVSQDNITAELATHPEWRGSMGTSSEQGGVKTPLTPEMAEAAKNIPTPAVGAESKIAPLSRLGTEKADNAESDEAALKKKLNDLFGF